MELEERLRDELRSASKKLHISRQFLDSVWFTLDDAQSSDFSSAALLCEPFMKDYYGEDSCASVHAISSNSSDGDFYCSSDHKFADALPTFTSSACGHLRADASSAVCTTDVSKYSSKANHKVPMKNPARKVKTLPCIKGRPVGVTGYRFIHEHKFQTKNTSATFYDGYALQFPKVFGLKTAKAKSIMNLVCKRNRMLEIWAQENTHHSKRDIAKWISEID